LLLILSIRLDRGESEQDVRLEVLSLNLLPLGSEISHGPLGELDFIRGEFSVLTQSIEADNELDLTSLEGLGFDLFPLAIHRGSSFFLIAIIIVILLVN